MGYKNSNARGISKRFIGHPSAWRALLTRGGASAFSATAFLLLATCSHSPNRLDRIQNEGVLTFATTNSPTTYYQGAYGPAGPDYDLARLLAEKLGVRLKVITVPNGRAALQAVADGRAEIAAPGVSVNPKDYPRLRFTPPYQLVSRVLVYRNGEAVPSDLPSLSSPDFPITIAESYAPLLKRLSSDYPGIHWHARNNAGTDELLVDLAQGKIQYTIANANAFRIDSRYYPSLRKAFDIGTAQPMAWAVRRDPDQTLYQATVSFFSQIQANKHLAEVLHRYYGNLKSFDRVNTQLFLSAVRRRFADYAKTFQRAARATGINWQLLAAVGFQESHWNPRAISPTGVRGIMMLTQPTAQRLGIQNRISPKLSIIGGARYLSQLRRRLPNGIREPDRTWMALAAYNIGYGHLQDARHLAKRLGYNPNKWANVKKVLPLLSERRYYRHAPHGFANGEEPVIYVSNIRTYYNVLMWRTAQNTLPGNIGQTTTILPASN